MKHSIRWPALVIFTLITIQFLMACSQRRADGDQALDSESTEAPGAIPSFPTTAPLVKAQIGAWMTGYFALSKALSADSLVGARTAAAGLLATTEQFDLSKLTGEQMDFYIIQSSKLKAGLQAIRNSSGIEQARSDLAGVSEAMYAVVKAFRANADPLYYHYCPMARDNKGANWLSATEELVNPYMGKMMLHCGRTQEKLNGL